jgi:hypothetical protein
MIKKSICLLILFSFVLTLPSFGRIETKKYTFFVRRNRGSSIDQVKFTKNSKGVYNIQIPEYIEKLGFSVTNQSWNSKNSYVTLTVSAQRSVSADTAIMSYSWLPQFVWKVDGAKKVVAENKMARDWMTKGIF